jgi:hypothetical protein
MMPASAERTGIDGFGIASLVLGIAGLLPIPGLLSSVLALVFGYLSRSRRGRTQPGTAGIVLGWIGVTLAFAVFFVYFVVLGYPFPEIHRYRP